MFWPDGIRREQRKSGQVFKIQVLSMNKVAALQTLFYRSEDDKIEHGFSVFAFLPYE
jgi:hypothetical protein